MHYTWYDVEKEMLREIHANARFSAEERPAPGMDLATFARAAVILTIVLAFAIPAMV
ncbi:hypothetical protein [Salidesulfovibrio onnuriiensis]|uniref:hypothetical protein n=1 Tax=Salidesulfovibrio onnuriiensis TaxID=2583823 RepID=UPI00164F39E1|nr:hypothetical protein [Salidesulfovibrio onnuriiensis]